MIYSILASILIITALVLFFDLTPERVTDDILKIITPKDSMRERVKNLRGNRKQIYGIGGFVFKCFTRCGVVLVTRHARGTVIQNNHRPRSFVIHHIHKRIYARM